MFLNECKGIIFEYTLNEVFDALGLSTDDYLLEGSMDVKALIDALTGGLSDNDEYTKMFKGWNQLPFQELFIYLLKRNARKAFFSTYNELESPLTDTNMKELRMRFYLLFNYSNMQYDRVLKEYAFYQRNINDLSSKINSETDGINRFNDTPQNGGDFADDAHTTTATTSKVTSSHDAATPVEMLDLTRRKLYNFIEEWIKSFDKFFWED